MTKQAKTTVKIYKSDKPDLDKIKENLGIHSDPDTLRFLMDFYLDSKKETLERIENESFNSLSKSMTTKEKAEFIVKAIISWNEKEAEKEISNFVHHRTARTLFLETGINAARLGKVLNDKDNPNIKALHNNYEKHFITAHTMESNLMYKDEKGSLVLDQFAAKEKQTKIFGEVFRAYGIAKLFDREAH